MESWCGHCKQMVGVDDALIVSTKNSRFRQTGTCMVCGGNTSRMVSQPVVDGEGLKEVGQWVAKHTLEAAPSKFRQFLKATDAPGLTVTQISVCRKALSGVFHKALAKVSPDGTKKVLSQPHDKLFHLWMNVTLSNGDVWLIQKNQRLNIEKGARSDGECSSQVTKVTRPLTTHTLMKNAMALHKKRHGNLSMFYRYSGLQFNCQYFIQTILDANGFGAQYRDFVSQDLDALKEDVLEGIFQTATDVGGFSNWVKEEVFGLGL